MASSIGYWMSNNIPILYHLACAGSSSSNSFSRFGAVYEREIVDHTVKTDTVYKFCYIPNWRVYVINQWINCQARYIWICNLSEYVLILNPEIKLLFTNKPRLAPITNYTTFPPHSNSSDKNWWTWFSTLLWFRLGYWFIISAKLVKACLSTSVMSSSSLKGDCFCLIINILI